MFTGSPRSTVMRLYHLISKITSAGVTAVKSGSHFWDKHNRKHRQEDGLQ